jgi:hypothetical protein
MRPDRTAVRRRRQVSEIVELMAAGRHERASGLALVHLAEFPEDADLLEPAVPSPPR